MKDFMLRLKDDIQSCRDDNIRIKNEMLIHIDTLEKLERMADYNDLLIKTYLEKIKELEDMNKSYKGEA